MGFLKNLVSEFLPTNGGDAATTGADEAPPEAPPPPEAAPSSTSRESEAGTEVTRLYTAGIEAVQRGRTGEAKSCFERAVLAGSGKCDAFEVAVPVASSYFELGRLATGPDHRHEATLRFQQSERVFARASEQAREQGLGELADRLREEAMSAAEQASGAATNSAGGTSSAMPNLLQQEKDLRARQWESWASHLGRI